MDDLGGLGKLGLWGITLIGLVSKVIGLIWGSYMME